MKYEIELSPKIVYRSLFVILMLVLVGIGHAHSSSPQGELPPLLSPALFDARRYLQETEGWLHALQVMNQEFLVLATQADADVLRLSAQVNHLAGRLFEIGAAIDRTQAPLGLEPLHGQLLDLVAGYEQGIQLFSTWLSAPTADHYNELIAYLQQLPTDLALLGNAVRTSDSDPAAIPGPMPTPTSLFQTGLQEFGWPDSLQSVASGCEGFDCDQSTRDPRPWE
jgi:hypothetical protein